MKFKYIPNYKDMRGGYDKLHGVVCTLAGKMEESSELGGEVAAAWLTFVESCKLQKKAALEVFNGYFQRIAEGRRDYDLITDEVLC